MSDAIRQWFFERDEATRWALVRLGLPLLIAMLSVAAQQLSPPRAEWSTLIPVIFLVLNMVASWRQRPVYPAKKKPRCFVRARSRWIGVEVLALMYLFAFEAIVPLVAESGVETLEEWKIVFGIFGFYAVLSIAADEHLRKAHSFIPRR